MELEDWKIVVKYVGGGEETFFAEDSGNAKGEWYEFSTKAGYKCFSAFSVIKIDSLYIGDENE